ncbi:phage major capsid protein [Stieleria sp. TO1_6]|uniref:phage major capsid protein n=1 Tax=Stieleria tagensis TaxID=2956795 RepID=UPI00209BA94D|nr:phage major capsid protein [Stieleria tagensis]MCO8124501.1 phage major capsid protein [Stieleria tagensis]
MTQNAFKIPREIQAISGAKLISLLTSQAKNEMVELAARTLSGIVIHYAAQNGVVRRFGNVANITPSMNAIPIVDSNSLEVSHVARLETKDPGDTTPRLKLVDPNPSKTYVRYIFSDELLEDSVALLNAMAKGAGNAIASDEDRNAFIGDGSESSGFVVGIVDALQASSLQSAATGNTSVDTLDIDDFLNVSEKLPELDAEKPRWFMSRSAYTKSVLRLAGADALTQSSPDDADGWLLNHRVHFIPGMPSADAAAGSTVALFGHLDQATVLGDYGDLRVTEHEIFSTCQTAVSIRKMSDFVCWDQGSTDPNDPAGAIVGLQLAEV